MYNISLQICETLRYCHRSNIIHRDLKPENVLMANKFNEHVKIIDFGISGISKAGRQGESSFAGSEMFCPPELITGQDFRASPAIDIWGFGCILY